MYSMIDDIRLSKIQFFHIESAFVWLKWLITQMFEILSTSLSFQCKIAKCHQFCSMVECFWAKLKKIVILPYFPIIKKPPHKFRLKKV
jgi:hypothetical protein